ncbi:MAG TPA: S-layer homology domain-containing protein [Oscillospiraceae bacterium]|nr:S-layer homology domain-containing protein [Oscillospiraceae bacterium]
MKKKNGQLAALLLAIVMILSFSATPLFAAGDQTFKDVPESAWYHGYVMMLYEKGIVKGYGETGEFRPGNKLTREQASKMVALAAGLAHEGLKANFPDVDKEGWASPYIAALKDKGAIQGFPDGTFRPLANIQRGHAAKIVALAFGLREGDMVSALADLPQDVDVRTAIEMLESNGIVKGYSDTNLFKPEEEINRAEFSKILCIAMVVASIQKAEADPTPENIAAAQALANQLPKKQDVPTQDYLQGRLDKVEEEEPPAGPVDPSPAEILAAALGGPKFATVSGNRVTLIENVTITGTVTVPAGVTLNTGGKSVSGSSGSTLEVYGTVYASKFEDVAQFLQNGGSAKFHVGSSLQVYDSGNSRTDTFIGADTMSIDSGYVTISLNSTYGFDLTITDGSTATIKGHHMDGNLNGYRIAKADCYSVAGTLNINYRTEVSGKLEVKTNGKIHVTSNGEIYIFDADSSGPGGSLTSAINSITGETDAKIINDSPAASTLNGHTLEKGKTYTWDAATQNWSGIAVEGLVAALGAANVTVDGNIVTLKADVTINDILIIPAGVTLNTGGKAVSGNGTVNVYGAVEAEAFTDVAGLVQAGHANFYAGSTLKIAGDTFIGENTMSVDEGFVTIGLHAYTTTDTGFQLTIPSGSTATIKGYHMSGTNDDYRIAQKDKYLVQGVLNIAYNRVLVTGLLEVEGSGKINIQSGSNVYLWGEGTHKKMISPVNTILGEAGAAIYNDLKGLSAGTLNGIDIKEGLSKYTWDNSTSAWKETER